MADTDNLIKRDRSSSDQKNLLFSRPSRNYSYAFLHLPRLKATTTNNEKLRIGSL